MTETLSMNREARSSLLLSYSRGAEGIEGKVLINRCQRRAKRLDQDSLVTSVVLSLLKLKAPLIILEEPIHNFSELRSTLFQK